MEFPAFNQFTSLIEEARRGVPLGTNSARAWEDAKNAVKHWFSGSRVVGVEKGSPRTGKIEFIVDIHGQGRMIITMGYVGSPRSFESGSWRPLSRALYKR